MRDEYFHENNIREKKLKQISQGQFSWVGNFPM